MSNGEPDSALPAFPPRAVVLARPGVEADAVAELLVAPDRAAGQATSMAGRYRTSRGFTWDVLLVAPAAGAAAVASFEPQVVLLAGVAAGFGDTSRGDPFIAPSAVELDRGGHVTFQWGPGVSDFTPSDLAAIGLEPTPVSPARQSWRAAPVIGGPGVDGLSDADRSALLRKHAATAIVIEPADSGLFDTLRDRIALPTLLTRVVRADPSAPVRPADARRAAAFALSTLSACTSRWSAQSQAFLDAVQELLEQQPERVVTVLEDAAREVIDRVEFPRTWALIQSVLGEAWRRMGEGERAAQLVRAQEAFEAALEILDARIEPERWARANRGLGQVLSAQRGEGRAGRIEEALRRFAGALEVQERLNLREEWASTQNAIGLAYRRRLEGDPAVNRERERNAFAAALGVFTEADHFLEWAAASVNLASALVTRLRGLPDNNRREALALAMRVVQPAHDRGFPELSAAAALTVGQIQLKRTDADRAPLLDTARQAVKLALSVYTRAGAPLDWALAQQALGEIHRDLALIVDSMVNRERAREAFEAALEVYTSEGLPYLAAATNINLGNVLRDLSPSLNAERASEAYRSACEIYRPGIDPREARIARTNWGRLLLLIGDAPAAYEVLRAAVECDRLVLATAQTDEARSAEAADSEQLNACFVECCLRLENREREAFLHADSSRSRLLRRQLGTFEIPAPEGVPDSILSEEARLLGMLTVPMPTVPARASGSDEDPDGSTWLDAVENAARAREALEQLWDTMSVDYSARDYVAFRRGDDLDWDELAAWIDEQARDLAIVEFVMLETLTVAFVLRRGSKRPTAVMLPCGRDEVDKCVRAFFFEVHRSTRKMPRHETWKRRAAVLLADVVPELEEAELVYLIPHGRLHYLPLHAVEHEGVALIERTPVVYAPSAAIAMRLGQADHRLGRPWAKGARGGTPLVVGNPTGDRPYAAREARSVAASFGVRALIGAKASKAAVSRRIVDTPLGHVAGHAHFDLDDPLASGIVLSEGEPEGVLSARELMREQLRARLLVLSGCETGLQDVRPGDELVGLCTALFYAGVPSLVLSLWAVDDDATADIMVRFYEALSSDGENSDGENAGTLADALRSAMLSVRAQQPPHTYLWAPFALFGRWW